MRRSYLAAIGFLFLGFSLPPALRADEPPPRSACSIHSHGTFWPMQANQDSRFLQNRAAAGELWVCQGDYDGDAYFSSRVHFFKWKRVTVRYSSLVSLKKEQENKRP